MPADGEVCNGAVARGLDAGNDRRVVIGILDRSQSGGLRKRVDVVAVTHAVEQADDLGVGQSIADSDARKRVSLRESSNHDQTRMSREQRNRVLFGKGRIGFIDDQQAREPGEHPLKLGVRECDARRRIRGGQKKRPGGRRNNAINRQTHRPVEWDDLRAPVLNSDQNRVKGV